MNEKQHTVFIFVYLNNSTRENKLILITKVNTVVNFESSLMFWSVLEADFHIILEFTFKFSLHLDLFH